MLKQLFVLLLTCSSHLAVNAAPVDDVEESGPWCDLTNTRVNASGRIVCRFIDEVENAQLDFYAQNGTGLPEIAVTCHTQCEVAKFFQDIIDIETSQDQSTLSLSLRALSAGAVGRYRCQASSVSTKQNVAGNCSFQLKNIKVGFGVSDDSDDTTPSEEEVGATYFLFLLLIIVVVAAVVIPVVICKKKACGLWRTRANFESDTTTKDDKSVPLRPSLASESSSLTKHREPEEDNGDNEERNLKGDENESVDDGDLLTENDDPEYDQPSDANSGDHGTDDRLKDPMMDKVRTEFAATHSPATCKKRTMLRRELNQVFKEEKKRSVKK